MVDSTQEIWKPVASLGGALSERYEVSDLGRVRNRDTGQVLQWRLNEWGYPQRSFKVNGRWIWCALHRLVLETFVGPPPEGHVARHLNGIADDARLANLAWGTRSENEADKKAHGTFLYGERAPGAKLTSERVIAIRAAPVRTSYAELAAQHGVSEGTIWDVLSRKTWRHLPGGRPPRRQRHRSERLNRELHGVSYEYGKWRVTLWVNRRRLPVGAFATPEEAARAYDAAAIGAFGPKAHLNFPVTVPTPQHARTSP